MKANDGIEYACSSHTSWIVEQRGVVLIDTNKNRSAQLCYPEAAIWDMLTRKWPRERLLRMLAVIAGADNDTAALLLEKCLEKWSGEGWLTCRTVP